MPTITTQDGRTLEYEVHGPTGGRPVMGLHGTPGSRLGRFPIGDPYAEADVCYVTYDRPGYGRSTRQPGRAVGDCARDAAAIADDLGWTTFAVIGGSGGGPHALACAALLPDRMTRVTCDVGIAPWDAKGLDWLDGMVDGNVAEFTAALQGEAALRTLLDAEIAALLERLSGDIRDVLGPNYPLPEADREVLAKPEFAAKFRNDIHESFVQGPDGWIDDELAFIRYWGFDLDLIKVPVKVRYGPDDVLTPAAHGRWLAANVPGAIEELKYGGHMGSGDLSEYVRQLRWLADG